MLLFQSYFDMDKSVKNSTSKKINIKEHINDFVKNTGKDTGKQIGMWVMSEFQEIDSKSTCHS